MSEIHNKQVNPEHPVYNHELSKYDSVRLGGNELAISGIIDLARNHNRLGARLVILDVSYRKNEEGAYGPYDVDGSGHKRTFTKPFVIVSSSGVGSENTTFTYEFDNDETVDIGRSTIAGKQLGLRDREQISRNHATVTSRSGRLVLNDYGSTNGSELLSPSQFMGIAGNEFFYTKHIGDEIDQVNREVRMPMNIDEGTKVHEGRRVILRDSPINGGVYVVGTKHGEAIVVDDENYPGELNEVYDQVLAKLGMNRNHSRLLRGMKRQKNGADPDFENVLKQTYKVVYDALRYDKQATDAIAGDLDKVTINTYITKGVGVCRTQAVLAAYLVERLGNEGYLPGVSVSIDRNLKQKIDGYSGHAWARVRDSSGRVYIIDPAQKYVGSLSDTYKDTGIWDYRRTEDIVAQLLSD